MTICLIPAYCRQAWYLCSHNLVLSVKSLPAAGRRGSFAFSPAVFSVVKLRGGFMARRKKITKKDLKHDKFVDTEIKILKYTKHHKNIAIGIAVGIIVILIAIPLLQGYWRNLGEEADSKLMQAELIYLKGDFQNAYMEFETIRSNYTKTPAGKKAIYFVAHLTQLQGRPDDAIKYFNEFLSTSKDPILAPAALLGIGVCWAQLGEIDKAVKSYEEAIRRFSNSYFAQEAYLKMAELKEAIGDVNSSIEIYKKIYDTYSGTDLAEQAEEKIAFLEGMSTVIRVEIPPELEGTLDAD